MVQGLPFHVPITAVNKSISYVGVEGTTTEPSDRANKPKSGDTVRVWYADYICEEKTPEKKGQQ